MYFAWISEGNSESHHNTGQSTINCSIIHITQLKIALHVRSPIVTIPHVQPRVPHVYAIIHTCIEERMQRREERKQIGTKRKRTGLN